MAGPCLAAWQGEGVGAGGKGASSIWGAFSRKLSGEVFSVRGGRGGAEEEVPAGEGIQGRACGWGKPLGRVGETVKQDCLPQTTL